MQSTPRGLRPCQARFSHLLLSPLLSLLVVFGGCGGEGASEPADSSAGRFARVTKVSDGDTIHLSGIGSTRLIGVDTPEVFGESECFGSQASEFLKGLLPLGSRVRYRAGVEARDRYGRFLAYVWLPDGRMLNRVLVEEGYATPLTIPPNVDFAERFRRAARAARDAGLGLWRACAQSG